MNALIAYVSIHHRNTKRIARTMAKTLEPDLAKPWKTEPNELMEYDLIGFGSGIYWWRHHWALFKLVESLPRMEEK